MNAEILQALDQGACVITATNRLRYEVKQAYDQTQLGRDKSVWPTANILTWESWMQSLWQNANVDTQAQNQKNSARLCLNNAQIEQLLIQIIEADLHKNPSRLQPQGAALWNLYSTATAALEAWQLCHQWGISFTALQHSAHEDHARFGAWATALYQRLQSENWISTAQIAAALNPKQCRLASQTLLFGFDHLNLQQQRFINQVQSSGQQIKLINSPHHPAQQVNRYCFEDTQTQWQQIGAWARQLLSDLPSARIGIITPDLSKTRALASQCLREQLTPNYFRQTCAAPFHFSQGGALAETPLVKSGLDCLSLLGNIEFSQLTDILLSIYWGSDIEQSYRAQLAIELQTKLTVEFDLFELSKALSFANQNEVGRVLLDKFTALQAIKVGHRGKQSLSVWHEVFDRCHQTLGWPASNLNSEDFQSHQAWLACLDSWVKLQRVCPEMNLTQALQSLNKHCQKMPFQAQAEPHIPIQIMGVLEAAELDFDAVWLAGFDEMAWPVVAHANPFIPVAQQIKAGIPAASTDLQAKHAGQKTQQLLSLCNQIQLSHVSVQDNITRSASPLISHYPCADSEQLPKVFNLADQIRQATPPLQQLRDDFGLALGAGHSGGGTGLVQKQSVCPFSAYAEYRLKLGQVSPPALGLDNLKRGSLLHEILASIWEELKTSNILCQHLKQDTLTPLITRHVEPLVQRFARLSGLGLGFVQAETNRLIQLMEEWLGLEAQRSPFAVEASEYPVEIEIKGLNLHFKLDRVDQLTTNGKSSSRLIMDYKSGNCELKHWAGERPEQPQIPLYYLALENQPATHTVEALCFGQVKRGESAFVGISLFEDTLPEVKRLETSANSALKKDMGEWSNLKPTWQARLNKLVEAFKVGEAYVDPNTPNACTYCDFTPLCRINTQNQNDE